MENIPQSSIIGKPMNPPLTPPRKGADQRRHSISSLSWYVLSVLAAPVATCSLSVSVQIVAGSDDFAERGSVSRSTLKAIDVLDVSKRWAAGKAPAGHRPPLVAASPRRAVSQVFNLLRSKGTAESQPN
jgi:hypothetical protein